MPHTSQMKIRIRQFPWAEIKVSSGTLPRGSRGEFALLPFSAPRPALPPSSSPGPSLQSQAGSGAPCLAFTWPSLVSATESLLPSSYKDTRLTFRTHLDGPRQCPYTGPFITPVQLPVSLKVTFAASRGKDLSVAGGHC